MDVVLDTEVDANAILNIQLIHVGFLGEALAASAWLLIKTFGIDSEYSCADSLK